MGQIAEPDYRFIFESLPNAMLLVLSPDFTMLAVNDVWCAATATSRAAAVGNNLFDVFPDNPEDLNADGVSHVRTSLDRVLREKVTDVMPPLKYDIEMPDGGYEERYWTITNSPLLSADGSVAAILNRADDVTAFIQLREIEERAAATLEADEVGFESIVVRQTRDAAAASLELKEANADLARMYTEAEASATKLSHANRDLEQFAYVVSHDLQAPVRNIAGIAELLRERFEDRDLSNEDRHLFQLLDQSTSRMLDQIQAMLKISRLQTTLPTWSVVDLAEVVREAIDTHSAMIKQTSATVAIEGDLPAVDADPVQLSLLMQNLIGNAIKYRQLDTPAVVEVFAADEGEFVEICVKDNGIGIDADHHERIFRMFQRLHSSRETDYAGTGIGLALALKIVRIHSGEIWVESAGKGTGSTFHVRLPSRQVNTQSKLE